MDLEALKYPIGKYQPVDHPTPEQREAWIQAVESTPGLLRQAVGGLSDEQLNTPYRPDGWTVNQLVHHIGDSHMNSIIRFKWTLTEDNPTIKAYNQTRWAETPDVGDTPLAVNLDFIDATHKKWSLLLRSMAAEDWSKTLVHPETGRQLTLNWMLGLYAWHGKHHVAHITALRERMGW